MDLTLDLVDFKLPPPRDLPEEARDVIINSSLVRIWEGSKDLQMDMAVEMESPGLAATDMWMLLIVRLITRVVDPAIMQQDRKEEGEPTDDGTVASELYSHQDRLRQTLCDYIMADFSGR
jgi:symplekin